MKILRNEKGIALVLVLMLSLMGLAMVAALLLMVTQSTGVSGYHRVFRSAEDAGLGGASITAEFIRTNIPAAVMGYTLSDLSDHVGNLAALNANNPCIVQKLTLPTANWSSCTSDPAYDNSVDPTRFTDFRFTLNDTFGWVGLRDYNYTVFTKIVNTIPGNTDTGGLAPGALRGPGVIDSQGRISPAATPTLYRVEVQAQATNNPTESSKYSVLYAY
ncbi:MAG: hypothetical protein ACM3MB_01605 [Acidobacteriota bacterium]